MSFGALVLRDESSRGAGADGDVDITPRTNQDRSAGGRSFPRNRRTPGSKIHLR